MNLKLKRLFIYDLDGTLIDTRRDIADAANHVRVSQGMTRLEDEKIWKFVGKGLFHLVQQCLQTNDSEVIRTAAKIYRKFYAEHMLDKSELYPGVRKFLELFRGRRQAVITNKPNPFTETLLKELAVDRYFFRVIAGDSEFAHKPAPESTRALMKQAGVRPSEVLWVGDSAVDIETARAAGVEIAVLSQGFADKAKLKAAKPDCLFKNFPEFVKFARKDLFGGLL